MDVNDRQENGPEEQPSAEGPQAPAGEQPSAEGPQAPAGEQPTAQQPPPRKRLVRSRSDRVVGGVAGGLGQYFNVDPLFFRIGAVALAFVGGAGLLLYLAALLLMPSEGEPAPVAPGTQGRNRALVIAAIVVLLLVAWPFLLGGGLLLAGIGIPLAILVGTGVLVWWLVSGEGPSGEAGDIARRAALGIGVLILCGVILLVGGFAAAAGPDWLVPAFLIAAGAAIAVGAFMKPLRWLVLPALTLGLAAGFVAAADIDLDGGVGEETYRPASAGELRPHYELGVGDLVIDLRDTDLPPGDVPLDLDVGIGQAHVIVPDEVCVATDAEVGMGNVRVFGRDHGGVDVDFEDQRSADPTTTRLLLNADVGLGQVQVNNSRGELFYDERDWEWFDEGDELAPYRGQSDACDGSGERARN
jgi:phage shock protein PspC (stress-responsive transcriptional regulator)